MLQVRVDKWENFLIYDVLPQVLTTTPKPKEITGVSLGYIFLKFCSPTLPQLKEGKESMNKPLCIFLLILEFLLNKKQFHY